MFPPSVIVGVPPVAVRLIAAAALRITIKVIADTCIPVDFLLFTTYLHADFSPILYLYYFKAQRQTVCITPRLAHRPLSARGIGAQFFSILFS